MELELTTDRLLLRPLIGEDLDLAIEMFTDPEVCKFVGGIQTAEEICNEMPNYLKRCGSGSIGVWCAIDRETAEKIGTGILLPMPIEEDDTNWDLVEGPDIPDCDIEIGYILKPSKWGEGYATEICKRLLKFAFEETSMVEVVACIDDGNEKSRHVLGKSGLRAEGRRLAYGEQSLCFRITQEQWLSDNNTATELIDGTI